MEGYIFASAVVALLLWVSWVGHYGIFRGTIATLLRIGWVLPLFIAFYPETRFENLARTVALKPIHILIDDSQSVSKNKSFQDQINTYKSTLDEECLRLGCVPKTSLLSDLAPETKEGYSPISKVLDSWFYGTSGDPWILISDGGDYRPTQAWDSKFRGYGRDSTTKPKGMILGLQESSQGNIWIEGHDGSVFSFADAPLDLSLTIRRKRAQLDRETTQIQVVSEDNILTSMNVTFAPDEDTLKLQIPLSSLPKGQHLLSIKVLPGAQETALWDNEFHQHIEVLPNTIGVLHLLGSPSWDGRFLRRYLKAEPKFDLISFFILRDPGDMQLVNERELSLIPFPVDRLFNEELPNFHLVILQNFTLSQFLEQPYQRNLVDFVKNGGGLLFLGGDRALTPGDADNSSLATILPYQVDPRSRFTGSLMNRMQGIDRSGPFYDQSLDFTIKLADPSLEQRDLANIFEDYSLLAPQLSKLTGLKGLHRVDNVSFLPDAHTPLLLADQGGGKELPLVVASYPGKGRALWVFTDSLHKAALNPGEAGSRDVYQKFLDASVNWLLRQELKKPLIIRNLAIDNSQSMGTKFKLNFVGSAGKYLTEGGEWHFNICGQALNLNQFQIDKIGFENWELSGPLKKQVADGSRCTAEIQANHTAFGSLKARSATVVSQQLKDVDIGGSLAKLESLSTLTQARLIEDQTKSRDALVGFLDEVTGRHGVSYPSRFRAVQDHFWMLNRWWFFLFLLAIPLEVVVRRWPQLTAQQQKGAFEAT